jgi:hypothetical protein
MPMIYKQFSGAGMNRLTNLKVIAILVLMLLASL